MFNHILLYFSSKDESFFFFETALKEGVKRNIGLCVCRVGANMKITHAHTCKPVQNEFVLNQEDEMPYVS